MNEKKKIKINLLKLAFKNLGRHKVKSGLTIIAITFGIFLYIWMDAWLLGMNIDSKRNLVNYENGSAKIYSKAYFEKKEEMPLYESFNNYDVIVKKLDDNGFNACPHAVFAGSLRSEDQELPFVFIGIDPDMENKIFKYYKFVDPPYMITQDDFENKILIKLNKNQINTLRYFYLMNPFDSNYYLKEKLIDNNKQLNEINKKIEKLEESLKIKSEKNKKSKSEKKYKDLVSEKNRFVTKLEREQLDKIKNILTGIGYYNFVKKGNFEILIGIRGAKDLKVKIGDEVTMNVIVDKKDDLGRIRHIPRVMYLKIAGIINSPNPKTNGNIAYIPLDILDGDLGISLEGYITEICIRKKNASQTALPGKDESPEVIKSILGSTLRNDLVLINWLEDAQEYIAMSRQDSVSTYILVGLLFILAAIGIANTMLMAVFERTKEIGMLRAMGMKDFDILKLFLIEAGLIGLIGSIFGIIAGIIINIYMVSYGIDYTYIMDQANMQDIGYRVVGIYKSAWNWSTIIASGIIATILSAIFAFFPARKAIKMSIVDTLRFE